MANIITFTGESGSGKSTIASLLLDSRKFEIITSTTTRSPRSSNLANEYEHVSVEDFAQLKKEKAFIWAAKYAGNNYGTKYEYIDEALQSDDHCIMILVPSVVPILLDYTDKVKPFFIRTPSEKILRDRLQQRGDSSEDIEKRLRSLGEWEKEAKQSKIPYLFVTNDGSIDEVIKQVVGYLK